MKRILTSFLILSSIVANAQLDIKVTIENYLQDSVRLAYHMGDKQYVLSSYAAKNGVVRIKGTEKLEAGIYMIALNPDNKYFEVIVPDYDQEFQLKTSVDDLGTIEVSGSIDNEIHQKRTAYVNSFMEDLKKYNEAINDKDTPQTVKDQATKARTKIYNDVGIKTDQWMVGNEKTFIYDIYKSSQDPVIPDMAPLKYAKKQNWRYEYYRDHYWQNWNFKQPGLVRTPIFKARYTRFIEQLTYQNPDSLTKWSFYLIDRCKDSKDQFQYILIELLNKYAKSKKVGFDKVYVNLVNRYYKTGMAPWTEEAQLKKIIETANSLEPILVGKIAPDFTLQKVDGGQATLHKYESEVTILIFADIDCGHCKKEMKELNEWYKTSAFKDDPRVKFVRVWKRADNTDQYFTRLKEFVNEHPVKGIDLKMYSGPTKNVNITYNIKATPAVFVLDSKKEIFSKRIAVSQFDEVLNYYFEKK